MKYGISTLMFLVFAASVVLGVVLKGSFLAFGMGFVALAVLIMQLMSKPPVGPVVLREFSSTPAAYLLRDHLMDHGVHAVVDEGRSSLVTTGFASPRVLVSNQDAERALRIVEAIESQRKDAPVQPQRHEVNQPANEQ